MFLDWQFTGENDEMLDPARYQYRETFVLLDAHWRDMAIAYCPYIYVDNDAAIMRGMTQGFPKKLGTTFQTRSCAAPSPAAVPLAAGSKFGASLSAHGERLVDVRKPFVSRSRTLRRCSTDRRSCGAISRASTARSTTSRR